VPVNGAWREQTINLTRAVSYFESQQEGNTVFWHLHPEMIDTHKDGSHSAALCPSCHDSIVVLGKIPKLSMAAGVDFGHFDRLGLTHPNLHEQLVLSRTRLHFPMFKISSNAKGQVNMNTQNKVR
jgi:hypothetical protein